MRTSNKLLIGFFAMVFITPVLMGLALKKKIKAGDYYVVDDTGFNLGANRKQLAKQPQVIILRGTPGYAGCNIISSEKPACDFSFGNEGDYTVTEKGDTLEIEFRRVNANDPETYRAKVNLYLPTLPELKADGVEVSISGSQAFNTGAWTVSLVNGSSISIGDEQLKEAGGKTGTGFITVQKLSAQVNKSRILLGEHTTVGELHILAADAASLQMAPSARIENISGTIDSTTTISTSGKYLLPLSKLIKQ